MSKKPETVTVKPRWYDGHPVTEFVLTPVSYADNYWDVTLNGVMVGKVARHAKHHGGATWAYATPAPDGVWRYVHGEKNRSDALRVLAEQAARRAR